MMTYKNLLLGAVHFLWIAHVSAAAPGVAVPGVAPSPVVAPAPVSGLAAPQAAAPSVAPQAGAPGVAVPAIPGMAIPTAPGLTAPAMAPVPTPTLTLTPPSLLAPGVAPGVTTPSASPTPAAPIPAATAPQSLSNPSAATVAAPGIIAPVVAATVPVSPKTEAAPDPANTAIPEPVAAAPAVDPNKDAAGTAGIAEGQEDPRLAKIREKRQRIIDAITSKGAVPLTKANTTWAKLEEGLSLTPISIAEGGSIVCRAQSKSGKLLIGEVYSQPGLDQGDAMLCKIVGDADVEVHDEFQILFARIKNGDNTWVPMLTGLNEKLETGYYNINAGEMVSREDEVAPFMAGAVCRVPLAHDPSQFKLGRVDMTEKACYTPNKEGNSFKKLQGDDLSNVEVLLKIQEKKDD